MCSLQRFLLLLVPRLSTILAVVIRLITGKDTLHPQLQMAIYLLYTSGTADGGVAGAGAGGVAGCAVTSFLHFYNVRTTKCCGNRRCGSRRLPAKSNLLHWKKQCKLISLAGGYTKTYHSRTDSVLKSYILAVHLYLHLCIPISICISGFSCGSLVSWSCVVCPGLPAGFLFIFSLVSQYTQHVLSPHCYIKRLPHGTGTVSLQDAGHKDLSWEKV